MELERNWNVPKRKKEIGIARSLDFLSFCPPPPSLRRIRLINATFDKVDSSTSLSKVVQIARYPKALTAPTWLKHADMHKIYLIPVSIIFTWKFSLSLSLSLSFSLFLFGLSSAAYLRPSSLCSFHIYIEGQSRLSNDSAIIPSIFSSARRTSSFDFDDVRQSFASCDTCLPRSTAFWSGKEMLTCRTGS